MSDLTSEEIALFAKVVAKIKENFYDRMDDGELKKFKGFLATLDNVRSAKEEEAGGKRASNRVAFDAAMKDATALLKTLLARPKPEKAEQTPAKVDWVVTKYDDEGDCEKAAENSGKIVEKAYKRDKAKYMQRDIDEGDLGVLYETNLTTSGDKYSLFFKYVRESEGKAKMVGVAIGSHSGSGNKYYVVKKDGSASKSQISATKKL